MIRAFMDGGRVGLSCLKKVLPNIFKTYPLCEPKGVLAECGLFVLDNGAGEEFPTFFLNADKEGRWMVEPFGNPSRKRQREVPEKKLNISEELQHAYDALRSEWDS